jgi:tryptophan synthase alpha subunit
VEPLFCFLAIRMEMFYVTELSLKTAQSKKLSAFSLCKGQQADQRKKQLAKAKSGWVYCVMRNVSNGNNSVAEP